jgi:hypothetical protein
VVHGPVLEQLVRSEVRLLRARRALARGGAYEVDARSGATRRSAYAVECDAAEAAYRRWLGEFGATPAQATRVAGAPREPAAPAEEDTTARFFGGAS